MDWAEITLQTINLPFLKLLRWKLKSIFELAENLSLVLIKLDTELGLAQPQLVFNIITITLNKSYENKNIHILRAHWRVPRGLKV